MDLHDQQRTVYLWITCIEDLDVLLLAFGGRCAYLGVSNRLEEELELPL